MNEERLGRDKWRIVGRDKWRIVGKGWMKKGWEEMNEWMKNNKERMNEERLGRNKWRIVRKG